VGGSDVSQIILDPVTGNPSLGATTFSSGNIPECIVLSPDQQNLYVGTELGTVEQFHINQITGAPVFVTSLSEPGSDFFSIAMAPDGKNIYVLDTNNNLVYQFSINPSSGNPSFVASVSGGSASRGLAITPNGTFLYIIHSTDVMTQMSIDSTGGLTPTGASATSGNSGIAIAPNGNYAYSTQSSLNEVIQTNLNPFSSTANTAGTQMNPTAITIAPDGKNAYVSNTGHNSVTQIILNTSTGVPTTGAITLSGGVFTNHLAVAPDQKNAYVVNSGSNNVVQIALDPTGVPSMTSFTSNSGGTGPIGIVIATLPSLSSPNGQQKKNRFLTQTDIYNLITWQGLPLAVFYAIYRDAAHTDLAATVPADATFLEFEDHNRKKGVSYSYYIVAVDANSIQTDLVPVTVLSND
jgi:DNA-binding beta-propeller fold protein YncE